jgi:hypothetical protein
MLRGYIVKALEGLESKTEINRTMNNTLEAMARALFKSWFVDFDPVGAKAEGRTTGLSAPAAALFSDSLKKSSLGEIPTGWTVEPIGNLTDVIGGTTASTKVPEYWAPDTHTWATPKELSNLQTPVLLKTDRRVSGKGLTQIGSGLLPVGTVLLSSRAPIGYLAIVEAGQEKAAAEIDDAGVGVGEFSNRCVIADRENPGTHRAPLPGRWAAPDFRSIAWR